MSPPRIEIHQQRLPERTFGVNQDLSSLTPRGLADYHLALAVDVGNPLVPDKVKWNVEEVITETHRSLLIATADAITKELMPWGEVQGDKATLAGQTLDEALGRNEAATRIGQSESFRARYVNAADEQIFQDSISRVSGGTVKGDVFHNIGVDPLRVIFGMRQELMRSEEDPHKQNRIISDILFVGREIFGEIVSRHDNPTPRERAWYDIVLCALLLQAKSPSPGHEARRESIIEANNLIGSIHGGGETILDRMSILDPKREGYKAVLDASRVSDWAVRSLAGEAGKKFYVYKQMTAAVLNKINVESYP